MQLGQGDQLLLAQLGEGAADGFHGQAEVIGDVAAAHRQGDHVGRCPRRRAAGTQPQRDLAGAGEGLMARAPSDEGDEGWRLASPSPLVGEGNP